MAHDSRRFTIVGMSVYFYGLLYGLGWLALEVRDFSAIALVLKAMRKLST